jgi:purine-binding chemotaxis protein CheW
MKPSDTSSASHGSIEQFVVFALDAEEYAVPILSVVEVVPILDITPFPDAPDYIIGLANLRGKILPVLDLEKKFQLNNGTAGSREHIMVAESQQNIQFGILVDKVKEVLKIPSDAIQPAPEMIKAKIAAEYLPGVIILGSNDANAQVVRMLLILDMQKILSDKNIEQLHEAAKKVEVTQATAPINKEAI